MSALFHNIRKRRSPRFSHKSAESPTKKECLEPTCLGDFTAIPLEIIHMILSHLTVIELSKLCLISKPMLCLVEGYRMTVPGKAKFLLHRNVHCMERGENWPSDVIHAYYRLGLYMKRSSFLMSTSNRLKHIHPFITDTLVCKDDCGDGRRCISFYCYGTFLHTVIAGWDDVECHRVLDYIHQNTQIQKFVSKVLMCSPGVLPHLEVYIRSFYRRAFIDVLRKKEDKAFWLNQILKPYPLVHQARLLQILFLSKTSVGVNFTSIVRDRMDVTSLSDISNALVLLSECSAWNDDSLISVIDEIIALPSIWHAQNAASLLLNCGEKIIVKVLISKSINNRFSEIVCLAYHLLIVSVKAQRTIEKASVCIWAFIRELRSDERIRVITEIISTFKDAIFDLVETDGHPLQELEVILEAKSQFMQDIVGLAMDSIKDNKLPQSQFTQVHLTNVIGSLANASLIEE